MILLDSNIIIYSAKTDFLYLRPLLFNPDTSISMVSKVEVLGFHALIESEKQYFETAFQTTPLLPVKFKQSYNSNQKSRNSSKIKDEKSILADNWLSMLIKIKAHIVYPKL
jgi:hypothetical protein